MNKKILITGANGQLGSEIKALVGSENKNFIFIDIEDLDLTNKEETLSFLDNIKPDFIVNCAAYTAVDKAEEEPEKAMLLNAGLPEMLAAFCQKNSSLLIHISTDYVFSGEAFRPINETHPTEPKSTYGITKLKGEEFLSNNPFAIIIRTSWLYSSFGNNFLKSMLRLFNERDELKIVFDQIGSPTYAADLAAAVLKIIEQSERNFISGIYHYSNEGVASWFDFAYEIKELSNADCKLIPIESKDYPLPAARPWYSVLNKEKIKKTYTLKIPYWKDSLRNCLNRMNEVNSK